jgi:hypothetical protein
MKLPDFFESITAEALSFFIESEQEEHLHLDFKLVQSSSMQRDDRKNLAKAVSGFANSDGGVIVWGVDCRKNNSGIDCASRVVPIQNAALFLSSLNKYTGEAVNPILDGIVHREIQMRDGSSCVKTLVPASGSGPHMAKLGEDRYFKRSGDSFRKMEHFDLEDMFGRRAHPRLELMILDLKAGGSHESMSSSITRGLRALIGIKNSGRGVARAPYLALGVSSPYRISQYGVDGNGHHGLPRLVSGTPSIVQFGGTGLDVIHPGTTRAVTTVAGLFGDDDSSVAAVSIPYELGAEGVALISDTWSIAKTEVLKLLAENA